MKFLKYIIFLILIIVFSYMLVAYVLIFFPHYGKSQKKEKSIYLYHDSMHTNIILNLRDTHYNWQKLLQKLLKRRKYGYLSFGFGDKETYLNTPKWNDLKVSTALKALFINTPSLVHVEYLHNINIKSDYIIKIDIDKNQYKNIEKQILNTFGKEITFGYKGYGKDDIFYNSPYKYNLINTCNTWSGDILREANITMSYWTPLSCCVVKSLD